MRRWSSRSILYVSISCVVLCLFVYASSFSYPYHILPVQFPDAFRIAAHGTAVHHALHVREAVAAGVSHQREGYAPLVSVALQGAQADAEQGGHFLAGQPPFLRLYRLSVLILADVLRYLLNVPDQFLKGGTFYHYYVHNQYCFSCFCCKITGYGKGGLMTHI